MEPISQVREIEDEPPPFLRRWSRLYVAVACYLVLLIGTLFILTRVLSY